MIDTIHIAVCMKPIEGNFAQNAIEHGVSGLNVDGCRVGTTVETWPKSRSYPASDVDGHGSFSPGGHGAIQQTQPPPLGRWPANVLHDGSDEVKEQFPVGGGGNHKYHKEPSAGGMFGLEGRNRDDGGIGYGDTGSAARFFQTCESDDVGESDE